VVVAGNIGAPLSGVERAAWVVCEVSSFQLEDVHAFACEVAVLLNLEPDHLDRHASFEAYRAAKLRIFERARVAVVPRGLGLEGIEFSADDPLPAEPLLRGRHNRENAAAATAAARAAGVPEAAIASALTSFPGIPHRLEPIGEVAGVRFVNDSKATNVAAALRALEAYADEPVHLIAGGSLKGEGFEPLAAAIGANVRSIHLIGEAAAPLATALGGREVFVDETLPRALAHAAERARAGEVVLLSPACASYDQYRDFEQRGESFRALVAELRR
jgi:UDP-N-acetylmuramoylalanine--D-glutamate ligase